MTAYEIIKLQVYKPWHEMRNYELMWGTIDKIKKDKTPICDCSMALRNPLNDTRCKSETKNTKQPVKASEIMTDDWFGLRLHR